VLQVLSPWVYLVEDLITKPTAEVHVSRLRFSADKGLEVSEELLAQVAYIQEGREVEKFLDVREAAKSGKYEVLIKWNGLGESENSWEPADQVAADVPGPLKKLLVAKGKSPVARGLLKKLGG
jgi:hypothetical protein